MEAPAAEAEQEADDASLDTFAADRDSIVEAAKEDRAVGVVLFWKETQDNGYLSNWARTPFEIAGQRYSSVEQWVMACKATACEDEDVLAQIMASKSPRKMKALGRSLSAKMVARHWRVAEKWAAQLAGARAKFRQNAALAARLLRTGRKPLAEASPSDRVFGIGLAPSDPLAQDPANWRGQNLLGQALARVRDELRREALGLGPDSEPVEAALPAGAAPEELDDEAASDEDEPDDSPGVEDERAESSDG